MSVRKIVLAVGMCVALSACTTLNYTQTSTQIVGAADTAYITAYTAGKVMVAAGKLDPAKFTTLEAQAYSALLAVRLAAAAYQAGTGTLADVNTANASLTNAAASLKGN